MEFTFERMLGLWIGGFLTLCIFSFLYKDNPFYRFAEHLYVGVSAGYAMSVEFNNVLKPVVFGNLHKAYGELVSGNTLAQAWPYLSYIIPLVLGLLLLCRLWKRLNSASRYSLAFLVGINAGFNIVYTMQAQVLYQVKGTILPLWIPGDAVTTVLNWILVSGVLSGLVYFYFSREHKGVFFTATSRFGIWVLMIAFGAAYGNTVMARVSLLIGRLRFLQEWIGTVYMQVLSYIR
jgi:hypothetical protein